MATVTLKAFCLLLIATIWTVSGYKSFQKQIPNGDRIPHSCNRLVTWDGVGHERSGGAGPLNSFGRDFRAAGFVWTKELCQLDSDGDGKRNGAELGDPNCVWTTQGQTPSVTDVTQLSHPGVCEPLDTPACQEKNKFLDSVDECHPFANKTDWCPAITASDVKKLVIRFNETKIPATSDTVYMCQVFTLPSDDDYQIIAWQPFISNVEIMHHLALYVCDDPERRQMLDAMPFYYKTPTQCSMATICSSYSITWAFGVPSRCFHEQTGIPFGKSYYNKIIMQIHYNNPELRADYVDSSGLIVYYVKKQRPQNTGSVVVGQFDIAIPPKTPSTVVKANGFSGTCSSSVMAANKQYNVTSIYYHTHKLGAYGKLSLTKKSTGKVITILNRTIDYDRPVMFTFKANEILQLEPGDAIEIQCDYNSTKKSSWTFFGEKTSDEMCFAVFEMYPQPGNKMCQSTIDIGPHDPCSVETVMELENCSRPMFWYMLNLTAHSDPGSFEKSCSCSADSYPVPVCSSECYSFLNRTGFLSLAPCFSGPVFKTLGVSFDYAMLNIVQSQIQKCVQLKAPPPAGTFCKPKTPSDSLSLFAVKMQNFMAAIMSAINKFTMQ